MISRWGSAFVTACVGLFALVQTPAMAQVEWVTSLSATTTQRANDQHYATGAPDGSAVYITGLVDDGEAVRVRTVRMTATGVAQWTRWADGYTLATDAPLQAHSDGSVSVVFTGSPGTCVERISASGVRLMQFCETSNTSYPTLTSAPDGDVLFATGYPGYQRKVRKISPTGVVVWEQTAGTAVCCEIYGHGIDASGNYFELLANRFRTWRVTDGAIISDVLLSFNPGTQTSAVARAGGDLAVRESYTVAVNAVVATVSRYAANGTRKWRRDVVFPTVTSTQSVTILAGDTDTVYVVLTPYVDGDSQVAKLSSDGSILWQRHYSRARSVIPDGSGLVALRTDIIAGNGTNDSFIFPVAPGDGALGSPIIYSRPDVYAPNQWFAVNNGFVAAFQGNNPFAPYTTYPQSLRASSVFIGSPPGNRWVSVAEARPAASVSQADCLMPRLAKSGPTSWWARTQAAPQNAISSWSAVDGLSGTSQARTPLSVLGCGAPLTADGGQVVVTSGTAERIKKVSATGAPVWQTSSSSSPVYYGLSALEAIASNGEITYATGSLLGRATAAGSIVFETETNRQTPRYLAVDSANHAWVVSASSSGEGHVTKVAPGGALQWSIAVDTPTCSDALMSALLTSADEMLVATQSCGEGRVFKINGAGQIVWQRIFSGTTLRPYVQLGALGTDSSGNIYAGGCAADNSPASTGVNAMSVLASWTGSGSERWTAQGDLIGGASECVTSIATDSSNNVYAASSSSTATRAPVLWSFTSAGVERWRHSGVLTSPFAGATELRVDGADKLVALGEAPPSSTGPRDVTLRRIDVASLGSPLRLKFLEVPSAPVGYREQFPVRIGLRTAADVASNATSDTVVSIGLNSGTGTLDGSLTCTIATGASECTVADSRYDVVESGVTFTAGADGFATATSSPIGFRKADTTTVISTSSNAPYNAFSVVRVRAAVQGPPPPANQGLGGSLSGPYSPTNPGISNCAYGSTPSALSVSDCDLLVYTASMPLSAEFNAYDNRYSSSAASGFSLPITKVMPTLVVSNDPGNSYVGGDRVRFRVALMLSGGFNASPFISANTLTMTGGTCTNWVTTGSVSDQFAGSYRVCEVAAAAIGQLDVSIGFTGSDDLLAAPTVVHSVTINPGAIIRGYANVPTSVTVCSPTPGVTCSIEPSYGGAWQCVGPVGMSGQVFFVPTVPGGSYNFTGSPVNFSNVNGLVTSPASVTWAHQIYACKPDVDGDGAVLAMTDGVLVLRRMLGLSGAALTEDVTHACAPLSAAGITSFITLANYDLDGDGQVRADTDGLLLLRAMLGFRGSALVNGVIGAGATRQSESEILNYLRNTCAFPLNP